MRNMRINHKKYLQCQFIVLTLLTAISFTASGQNYTKRYALIPMRDGVKLYTEIYEPADTCRHPVLIMRTPYSLGHYGEDVFNKESFGLDSIYLKHNYIFVKQNVRGRYLSEGLFMQVRPYNAAKHGDATDEASDTYDTVEWLLLHCHTNGRVGVKGTSYPGFYALMAALSGHPAIKAVSPQAPIGDWFMGDDIHHNGALMLMDSYSFGSSFFRKRLAVSKKAMPSLLPVDTTVNIFYHRPLDNILSPVLEEGSFWQDIVGHPSYDEFWRKRRSANGVRGLKPAVMVVGGLFDAEDNYGTWSTWRNIQTMSPGTPLYLVEGPWYHHGWNNAKYQHLDDAWFGKGSAFYFMNDIEYPFFAYYLEDKGNRPAAVTLLPSMETARSKMQDRCSDSLWIRLESWPPRGMRYEAFRLRGDTVVSDPDNPVPYYHTLTTRSRKREYMAADQSFASVRKDVCTTMERELSDTLRLFGPVKVRLDLITDATDLDAIVKLIDVRPDGYQMLIRGDVMPARFRRSFEKPVPIKSGRKFSLSFTMPDIAHVVLPGHRLMVQVQYSCFPLIAVNPQKFLPNPYKATKQDYQKARVILLDSSVVELPVVTSRL